MKCRVLDTIEKDTKVPGTEKAPDWCGWGMLGALQEKVSDVQKALLPAWLRNALSSEEKARPSEAGKLF